MPQGTPRAVEVRLQYLEVELERRLLTHERPLRTFLRIHGIPWGALLSGGPWRG